jgi:hypothetical protein
VDGFVVEEWGGVRDVYDVYGFRVEGLGWRLEVKVKKGGGEG